MVHGRPFLFRIPTKETVVVFYSTLSPQKCTKINKKQQHAQGHLGSNLTPKRENRNFRKTVVTNSTNCYHQQHKLLSPTAQTVVTNSTNCYHQQHKLLSPAAQTHYADLADTSRDNITKVGVTLRYTKKVIEKNEGWGHI